MHRSIQCLFPDEYRRQLSFLWEQEDKLQEIRIRAGKPVLYKCGQVEWLGKSDGVPLIYEQIDLKKMIYHICKYSVYAFEEERKQGYMTLQGGHRLGISGKVIVENGVVTNFQMLSGFHFRMAHELYGIADSLMPFLYEDGRPLSLVIVSPPGFGKTTLLREIIRNFSNGTKYGPGINITVVDERSEIGGCYRGKAENDLGIRTDVLDGCPKVIGIMMAIRALGPDLIAMDEIGTEEEREMILRAVCCGVGFLLTMHGEGLEDLQNRLDSDMMKNGKIRRILVIQRSEGAIRYQIFDEKRHMLYG